MVLMRSRLIWSSALLVIFPTSAAKFLLQLGFCRVLTIICDKSKWMAPRRISLERGFTIEQLNMKIMKRYPQERPFTTVMVDFKQMSQRPVAVSTEVGEGNTVDHVKLHFMYQHEIYGCGRSWCRLEKLLGRA